MYWVLNFFVNGNRCGIALLLLLTGCQAKNEPWPASKSFGNKQVAALAIAAENGDVTEIDRLVTAGVDINTVGRDGMTPLFRAFWVKNKQGFERLLQHGANADLQLEDGRSVTSLAAKLKHEPFWLKMALEHGANPNLVDSKNPHVRGETPIFNAIRYHNPKGVQLLIDAGADLDHKSDDGTTPLMFAGGFDYFDIIYQLLVGGSDYRLQNKSGKDFTWRVADRIDSDLFYLEEEDGKGQEEWRAKVMEFFEREGVDLNAIRLENPKR
jgi:hypothetical protein